MSKQIEKLEDEIYKAIYYTNSITDIIKKIRVVFKKAGYRKTQKNKL